MEKGKKTAITEKKLEQIRILAESMQYGSLNLIFQDGLLVQIDRNEKIRVTGRTG